MGESSQATARLRGFWRRGEEGGALNAVHGAGKNAASFHCNQTSGVDWGGGGEKPTPAVENSFSPRKCGKYACGCTV